MNSGRPTHNSTDAGPTEPNTVSAVVPALTVKEAAARLGVSANLVYTLCARAKIRHERHGLGRGVIRIPPEALDEYRKQATVAGTSGAATPPPAPPRVKLSHIKL